MYFIICLRLKFKELNKTLNVKKVVFSKFTKSKKFIME